MMAGGCPESSVRLLGIKRTSRFRLNPVIQDVMAVSRKPNFAKPALIDQVWNISRVSDSG